MLARKINQITKLTNGVLVVVSKSADLLVDLKFWPSYEMAYSPPLAYLVFSSNNMYSVCV